MTNASDTDAVDLWLRAAAIADELASIVEEALRVRDQHAARLDALVAERARNERRAARMRRTIRRLRGQRAKK